MQWTLRKYAVVNDVGLIVRFEDERLRLGEGEQHLLPVVADNDPPYDPETQELWGPEYELLPDRVRAYCKVMPLDQSRLLEKKLARLEEMEQRLTAVETRRA